MGSRLAATILALILPVATAAAQDKPEPTRKIPPKLQMTLDLIVNEDYPEVFKDKHYQFRPSGYDIVDIDGDGTEEIFVVNYPHYRQSPTILIYQLAGGKVRRVAEGLAPGPLVQLSGDYLDSHTLGMGTDFTSETEDAKPFDAERRRAFLEALLAQESRVVQYRHFTHMDKPEGTGGFVDLTHLPPFDGENSCAAFEFSRVQGIKSGKLSGDDSRVYLVTAAGGEIHTYRIDGLDKKGLLDKRLWITPQPVDFAGFIVSGDGYVGYQDSSGGLKPLRAPTGKPVGAR